MKYTLITSRGSVMTFFVKAVADLYFSLYGGVLVTDFILEDTEETVG